MEIPLTATSASDHPCPAPRPGIFFYQAEGWLRILGRKLWEKQLSIIRTGMIGREVAAIERGFGGTGR